MQEPQTLALQFVNAGAGPDGDDPLRSPKETARWLQDALAHVGPHRLDADPTVTILHRDALALRSSLRALLTAHRDGAPPQEQDLWLMNACLAESSTVTGVRVTTEGSLTVDTTHVPRGPRASLGVIAADAAHLLVGVDPGRLRTCAAERCTRWFVDTSKNGRRRWCSMATCGNRAKAARHRERLAGRS